MAALIAALLFVLPEMALSRAVTVRVDGHAVSFQDVQPLLIEGRVMVPVRELGGALGARVDYDSSSRAIRLLHGDRLLELPLGTTMLVRGRALAPLRQVTTSLGASLSWDGVVLSASLDTEAPSDRS